MKSAVSTVYSALRNELAKFLKDFSFSRRGNTFYLKTSSSWCLINLQKSTKSDQSRVLFTVNLGIYLDCLGRVTLPLKKALYPSVENCHLRVRLLALIPPHHDSWISIDTTTDLEVIKREIEDKLRNHGIPFLRLHSDERTLLCLWSQGKSPGITDLQRLRFMTILLAKFGPREECEDALHSLKQRESTAAFERHLGLLTELRVHENFDR